MAKQYGVALMTLQRALSTLSAEGLLVSYQGRGVWVRSPEHEAPEDSADVATLADRLRTMEAHIEELTNRVRELESARAPRGRKASSRSPHPA